MPNSNAEPNIFVDHIPALFHPSKIVLIDDSESFVQALEVFLKYDRILAKFTNPHQAFDFLIDYDKHFQKQTFQFAGIETLITYLNSPQRFEQIAVIVCDYDMPIEDGCSFFKRVTENIQIPFKRLLLTGATQNEAERLAQIAKVTTALSKSKLVNDLDMIQPLLQKLEYNFFERVYDVSDIIPILATQAYIDSFNGIMAENDIIEGYLFDSEGRYLLLSDNDEIFMLSADLEIETVNKEEIFSNVISYRKVIDGVRSC